MKIEDNREYLGENNDIIKIIGIVQHIGSVGSKQTICLSSIKIYKSNGSIEKCDHTWVQNSTNFKLSHKYVGKIIKIEGKIHTYIKYNRDMKKHIEKKGITLLKIL